MSEKILGARMINKHDTQVNWESVPDFVPYEGEIVVYDTDDNFAYPRFKIGDGITTIGELPFSVEVAAQPMLDSLTAADVKALAEENYYGLVFKEADTIISAKSLEGANINCITTIDLIQNGEGTASLTNIRPFQSYNNLKLYRNNENFFNFSGSVSGKANYTKGATTKISDSGILSISGSTNNTTSSITNYTYSKFDEILILPKGSYSLTHSKTGGQILTPPTSSSGAPTMWNDVEILKIVNQKTKTEYILSTSSDLINIEAEEEVNYFDVYAAFFAPYGQLVSFYSPTYIIKLKPIEISSPNGSLPYEHSNKGYYCEKILNEPVCGGSINWGKGQLIISHKVKICDGTELWSSPISGYYAIPLPEEAIYGTEAGCSHGRCGFTTDSSGNQFIGIGDVGSTYNTVDAWKTYVAEQYAAGTPVTFAYKTEKIEQFEPMQIPAINGNNYIWSNCGKTSGLFNVSPNTTDPTLSLEGVAADAASVGRAINKTNLPLSTNTEQSYLRSTWSIEESEDYPLGNQAVALGKDSCALGDYSFAEGLYTVALGEAAHAEGSSFSTTPAPPAKIKISGAKNALTYTYELVSGALTSGHYIVYKRDVGQIVSFTTNTVTLNKTLSFSEPIENQIAFVGSWGALGANSHAGGIGSLTAAQLAFAHGQGVRALGDSSFAIGQGTLATQTTSFAQGMGSQSTGVAAVAFGQGTNASNTAAFAMGSGTMASGMNSVAFGSGARALGTHSFVMGDNGTVAYSANSTAIGNNVEAFGGGSTAIGVNSKALGFRSFAIGSSVATGAFSMALGQSSSDPVSVTITGPANTTVYTLNTSLNSNYIGGYLVASSMSYSKITAISGTSVTVESTLSSTVLNSSKGWVIKTGALGTNSIITGYNATAKGPHSFAGGSGTTASGVAAFAYGSGATASGNDSFSFGAGTTAKGHQSVAFGGSTTAEGMGSFALGGGTKAIGQYSAAFGGGTTAKGDYSLALGGGATANGSYSFAFGTGAQANGMFSLAFGGGNTVFANGLASIAIGNGVTANGESQTVLGTLNIVDTLQANSSKGNYLYILGNGSGAIRSNAHTIDWNGNAWFQGSVYVGGTSQTNGAEKLLTQSDLAAILPVPTAADAGKILRVNSEGKYELVVLSNAEEATF